EALDDDGPVGGDGAGCRLLLGEEGEQVSCRPLVEGVVALEPRERLLLGERDELARRAADRLAELVRAPDALALPERHRARHARGRGDEHAVAGDLLDPPRRGAEEERLPRASLVDHLLVELADAAAAVDEMDAVEPAVWDRARVRDRETARAASPADDAGRAIPDHARPQLGELVRGVAAGQHVEDVLELGPREVRER